MLPIEVSLYGKKSFVNIDKRETVKSLLKKLEKTVEEEIWEPVIFLNGKALANEALDVELKDNDFLFILAKGFVMGG